jgi:hypothetical protein
MAPALSRAFSVFSCERSDGNRGFWSLVPSSFGALFRSGKSSGPDRTVAARSWLLTPGS